MLQLLQSYSFWSSERNEGWNIISQETRGLEGGVEHVAPHALLQLSTGEKHVLFLWVQHFDYFMTPTALKVVLIDSC